VRRLTREGIAWRAAQDLREGTYVNLGIGMPVLVAAHAPAGREIVFHSENGIVGVGPLASAETADPQLVDAGSRQVTLSRGAAIVDSTEAFAMIRGGHVEVTLLGGFEVAVNGDLANWDAPGSGKGQLVGGAMDLAVGAREVRVIMAHTTRSGAPRLLERCTLPLTAPGVVKRVYTDLAVADVERPGFVVRELIAGLEPGTLARLTGAALSFAPDCRTLGVPDGLLEDADA
jgi:3-oxoadipate CoA-transferase beta subunit